MKSEPRSVVLSQPNQAHLRDHVILEYVCEIMFRVGAETTYCLPFAVFPSIA